MNDFALYAIETGICLALFYSVYWIFLKKETFFAVNRLYLVSSVVFSFVIPFINIPSPIASRPLLEGSIVFSEVSRMPAQSLGISDILLLVYIWGVMFFLIRFVYQLLKVLILIRKSGVQKYNGLKVVFIEKDCSPFSFFNYVFINKSNISGDDFQRIIAHEMIHIKQYHSIDLLILEWLTIFQWFNPFVWPYKKSLKETHEYLADYAVIAQGCSAAKYQLLIFEQHVGVKLFELANNFNQSQIKRRITMMTKSKSKGLAKLKFLLIFPMVCFLILAFADSKTVREPEPADMESVDSAVPAEESSQAWTVKADQKLSDEAKKMLEELKQIEMTIKELEKQYEQTKDLEKRKKIKEKLAVLLEKRVYMHNKLSEEHHVEIKKVKKVDVAKIEEL
ncbi:MAG: M56 family metallopeptidase, partial [Candidatus Aminicenantes bacterium]